MKLKTELYDVLIDTLENGIDDPDKLANVMQDVADKVLLPIINYCEKHGDLALQCGGEWLYQSDEAQVDALELVAQILDKLSGYAEEDEDV